MGSLESSYRMGTANNFDLLSMRATVFACAAAGHFFNGDDAALQLSAADVLELDGGVADAKVVTEHLVEF